MVIRKGHTMGDIYAYKQVKILSDWNEVNTMAGDYIDMIAGLYGPNVSDADKKKYGFDPNPLNQVMFCGRTWTENHKIDQLDRVKVGNIYPKNGQEVSLPRFLYKNVSFIWTIWFCFRTYPFWIWWLCALWDSLLVLKYNKRKDWRLGRKRIQIPICRNLIMMILQ